jgi:hypothetical protein
VGGWINGTDSGDVEQLANINSTLNQIQAELADIETEMSEILSLLEKQQFANRVEDTTDPVNRISDAVGSYQAVLAAAAQISCRDASTPTCADPQSPAAVCASVNAQTLQQQCIALGDLPIPPGQAENFYTDNPPAAATNSLIGQFIWQITKNDPWDDSTVQTLANNVGGQVTEGQPPPDGVWQDGSAFYAGQQPYFLGTTTDQDIQYLASYYFSIFAEGLTMRSAYYGFDDVPESTYKSPVTRSLKDYFDLVMGAPAALPAGTFIDTAVSKGSTPPNNNGLMWSGQLGSIASTYAYGRLINQKASVTLPYSGAQPGDRANNAPGAQTPVLPDGQTPHDWAAATNAQLSQLISDTPPGPSTNTLVPGYFAGQILDNSTYGGTTIGWASGQAFDLAPQIQATNTSPGLDVIDAPIRCYPVSSCQLFTWAWGAPWGVTDLNTGENPNFSPSLQPDTTNNWWTNQQCPDISSQQCTFGQTYPGIINNWQLPVLYLRTPVGAGQGRGSECYFYYEPGCLTTPPTPPPTGPTRRSSSSASSSHTARAASPAR